MWVWSNLESQDDPYFKRNADECTRLKIPLGFIYILMQPMRSSIRS